MDQMGFTGKRGLMLNATILQDLFQGLPKARVQQAQGLQGEKDVCEHEVERKEMRGHCVKVTLVPTFSI